VSKKFVKTKRVKNFVDVFKIVAKIISSSKRKTSKIISEENPEGKFKV
jgi:hypothetical protein